MQAAYRCKKRELKNSSTWQKAISRPIRLAKSGVLVLLMALGGTKTGQAAGEVFPNLGGMLSPDIDVPGKPFSYFHKPTDILGTYLAPAATEVTPEGYLYNGFGDLMFFLGNPPEPVNQRIRTLHDGTVPIVEYEVEQNEVRYKFTALASDLGGALTRLPVNFVRVEAKNLSSEQRTAFISSAYRFSAPGTNYREGGDYRFLQNFGALPDRFTEGQKQFNPDWEYTITDDSLQRNDRVIYLFSNQPAPYQKSLSPGQRDPAGVRFLSGQIYMAPSKKTTKDSHMPMGYVTYRLKLNPGETKSVDFKYPIVPLPSESEEIAQVRSATFDEEFKRVKDFWKTQVADKLPLEFPESKVQEALAANTSYTLLSVNQVGDVIIPVCNKFQYNSHPDGYVTSHVIMALAELGYLDLAKQGALFDIRIQKPDGQWGNGKYWGYFGEIAVAWGRIFALTGDKKFLAEVFPSLMKGARRMEEVMKSDSEGVLPPITLGDDEMLQDARYTGQHVRTLQGLLYGIEMAQAMNSPEEEAYLRNLYNGFRAGFDRLLEKQTAKTKGYIPPALDMTTKGNDWDNLQLLYPQPLFDPFDNRISETIKYTRSRYREGILNYLIPSAIGEKEGEMEFNTREGIHYWQAFNNSFNALVRGGPQDQQDAVSDLYAQLLHTTSTHAPQEYGTLPWGSRGYSKSSNITPMMATSARLISLLRTMMVREEGDKLHLLSAVSPEWMKEEGQEVQVKDLKTTFGRTSLSVKTEKDGWTFQMKNQFENAPGELVFRIPWFIEASQIEVDGKAVELPQVALDRPAEITLPLNTQKVKIYGKANPEWASAFNYDALVSKYKQMYADAYEKFLQTGEVELRPDSETSFGLKVPKDILKATEAAN